jgi:protease I
MKKVLCGIIAAVLIAGNGGISLAEAKKAVLVIAAKDFQDDEFAKPREALQAAGISVTVASTTLNEVTGMNGAKVKPDMLLNNVKAENFDAVVFIGGSGAVQYLDDPVAHALAKNAVARQKIVGAICLAPVILANAGLLTGKRATCFPTQGSNLKMAKVVYTGKPVEKDGRIITADGPASAQAFGKELVKALGGK